MKDLPQQFRKVRMEANKGNQTQDSVFQTQYLFKMKAGTTEGETLLLWFEAQGLWSTSTGLQCAATAIAGKCWCHRKQKRTGWLQCNNNSDRLSEREKQLPCQQASASAVPTAEEKMLVGSHRQNKTKQPIKKAQGRRSVLRPASLQQAETTLAGTAVLGANMVSPVPHGAKNLIILPGIPCPQNGESSIFSPFFVCLGSGLPFAKHLLFTVGSDFPEDKHFFHCQNRSRGKWWKFVFWGHRDLTAEQSEGSPVGWVE